MRGGLMLRQLLLVLMTGALVGTLAGCGGGGGGNGESPGKGGPSDPHVPGDKDEVPEPPVNLLPTPGNEQVTLTWEILPGNPVTGYEYRTSGDGGATWSVWNSLASTVTASPDDSENPVTQSHVVTNLKNGQEYHFEVRTKNGKAKSDAVQTSETPLLNATVPRVPGNFKATVGNLKIVLSWKTPSNGGNPITSYQYRVSDDGGTTWSPDWGTIPGSGANTTSYTVTGLTNGVEYTLEVRARNIEGVSRLARTTATPAAVPDAPGSLRTTVGDRQVTLNWQTPSPGGSAISSYQYRVSRNGGTSWSPDWENIPGSESSTRSYKVTGLTNGRQYVFEVRAANAQGPGPVASTKAVPAMVPEAPGNFTAAASNNQVELRWKTPFHGGRSITSYEYRASPNGGTSWSPNWRAIPGSDATTINFIVESLTNGVMYTFEVRAVSSIGKGSAARTISQPASRPDRPRSLTATAGDAYVTLSWQAPSSNGGYSITSYKYRVSESGQVVVGWQTIPNSANTRRYTVRSLTNGVTYTFDLRAVSKVGESYSASIDGTPNGPITPRFTVPRSFTATAGNAQVILNWQPPSSNGNSAITHYSYRVRQTSSNSWSPNWTNVTGGASARSQTVTSLTNNTNYTFELRAVNGDGDGPAARTTATPVAPFTSVWRTRANNETITLPLRSGYNYNFTVDWGDGSTSTITAHDDTDKTHTYATPGDHTVTISGLVEAWYFNGRGDKNKLYQVTNLGGVGWKNLEKAFDGCVKLTTFAGGDVSEVTNMSSMFSGALAANPDVSGWDVSNVTDMSYMFDTATAARPDTSGWDTSSVTNMSRMFSGADVANPDVSGWDVSNVTDMSYMFSWALAANPDVSGWDTSQVIYMGRMFRRATSASPDMSQWDFANVVSMTDMFSGVTLPTANYSAMLKRIVATSSKSSVTLHAGSSKYDGSAAAARSTLVGRSWTITDGGIHNNNPFTSVWKTTSASESITLPLRSGYNYNFTVDWGDSSATSTVTSHNDNDRIHQYANSGEYTVTITGLVEAWYFNNGGSKDKIIQVTELGDMGWKNLEGAFYGCTNLTTVAGGDVSGVTNMRAMFYDATSANPDTSGWDTSSVTNMRAMFYQATSANPNTSGWNTSNVTSMAYMFYNATSANPDTSGWNTSSVMSMEAMFRAATSANPDTSGWDTSSVTNMERLFLLATSANPDVSRWDTSSVTNMTYMFRKATSANPDVSEWDTSSVTNMGYMFSETASANPNVSEWDTSSVTDMTYMFSRAESAEPDMSQWDFGKVTSMDGMFNGVTLPTDNYSAMLKRIVATSTKENVTLGGGYSKYDDSGETARTTLVDDRNWTITDGGWDTGGRLVTVWRTTSASESITLPLRSGYDYDFTVDWGDGSAEATVTAHNDTDITHTYTDAGDYTVIIDGTLEAWYFNGGGSKDKLIEVLDLGDVGWTNLERAFYGCSNLTTVAGGDVSGVTNMAEYV